MKQLSLDKSRRVAVAGVLVVAWCVACGEAPTDGAVEETTEEQQTETVPTTETTPDPEEVDPPALAAGYYKDMVQPIWNTACGECHGRNSTEERLNLVTLNSHLSLTNVQAKQPNDMLLVKPGSTDESYLWHKLQGTHLSVAGGEGKSMPIVNQVGARLSDDELAIIEAWISAGAPEPTSR